MRKALAHLIGVAALGQAQLAPVAEAQRRLAVLVLGIAIGHIVQRVRPCPLRPRHPPPRPLRSEEHTSELQSLMRISYAVFCLKKKTHRKPPRSAGLTIH